jgi:nicotinate-nucleotide--dimethylbenzimidazole phosphoribosyltransferase
VNRLVAELKRVFGDPPVAPRAVVRVQVASGQGLDAGREEGDRLVDAGAELVVLDSEGSSPEVLATLAVLLDLEPVALLPPSSDPQWRDDLLRLRSALRDLSAHRFEPERLVTDPALGRLVGLLDRLTARETPVLLGGGTAVAVAALVVCRLQPDCLRWLLAGSQPTEAPGELALGATQLVPLLDLGLGADGADVAVAVVRTGLELLGA